MIRRDFILRTIEDCVRVLTAIAGFRNAHRWEEAGSALDEEFKRLLGVGPQALARLSETELLAKLMQDGPTLMVREKTAILIRLLKEAGDLAAAQDRLEESRLHHLKGLHLLLDVLAESEIFEFPDFVPQVEMFLSALQDEPLPLRTQALLMQHYERVEDFGKAEDALFAMLDQEPWAPGLVDFGIVFYERLAGKVDSVLEAGNLPRAEVEAGLAELKRRHANLAGRK